MSIESLHMLLWALKRLERVTSSYSYKTEVLLSCMTLDLRKFTLISQAQARHKNNVIIRTEFFMEHLRVT